MDDALTKIDPNRLATQHNTSPPLIADPTVRSTWTRRRRNIYHSDVERSILNRDYHQHHHGTSQPADPPIYDSSMHRIREWHPFDHPNKNPHGSYDQDRPPSGCLGDAHQENGKQLSSPNNGGGGEAGGAIGGCGAGKPRSREEVIRTRQVRIIVFFVVLMVAVVALFGLLCLRYFAIYRQMSDKLYSFSPQLVSKTK
jgi:hypothetical protein